MRQERQHQGENQKSYYQSKFLLLTLERRKAICPNEAKVKGGWQSALRGSWGSLVSPRSFTSKYKPERGAATGRYGAPPDSEFSSFLWENWCRRQAESANATF